LIQPVFVDGVPARITIADFRRYYLQSFPKLSDDKYDELIQDAINAVYDIFTGINTLWSIQARYSQEVWYDKTRLCYGLLTAWYIADLYPTLTSKVPMMGGIPLVRKKIGGVDLTFSKDSTSTGKSDYQDLLLSLKSNPFGAKAYMMIRCAAKRVKLGNSKYAGV